MIRTIHKRSPKPPSTTRQAFSYTEVLLASILMAVLLVATVRLFGNLGRSRQHTIDKDTAARLAINLIEEIRAHPYTDPVAGAENGLGPGPGENLGNRTAFNDIDDYHNWTASPPQARNGQVLTQYYRFTRSVTVRYVASNDFTQTIDYDNDEGFKEVVITVSSPTRILEQQTYVIADFDPPS